MVCKNGFLRVIEKDTITDILAPMDEYPDLEMSRADLIQLRGRPSFFVIDRYRVYLVDLVTMSEESYADPADYEIGHPEPFLLLYEKGGNGKKTPWVIDLKKGTVIKGETAKRFIEKHPKP